MGKIDHVPVAVDIEANDEASVDALPFAQGIPVAMGTYEQDVEEMDDMNPPAINASESTSTRDPGKTENNDDMSSPKQGRLFCYCCCDMRIATIIINIILIIFTIINMVVIASVSQAAANEKKYDDYYGNYYNNNDSVYFDLKVSTIVVGLFSIGFSIAALIGAIKFNAWLVLLNAIWLVIGFVVSTIFIVQAKIFSEVGVFVFFSFLFTCFSMYPHLMLIYELKASKTMNRSTYAREKKTCC